MFLETIDSEDVANTDTKVAILLSCFDDRYRHLHVSLDSIFRMNYIEQVDVHIYLGGHQPNIYKVLSKFPVSSVTVHNYRGNDVFLYMLRDAFYVKGYDTALVTTDDEILHPRTLNYILNCFLLKHKNFYHKYRNKCP